MRCEVVAVGTELLLGQIVDTNSSYIGEQLALAGIDSLHQVKVGDNLGRMIDVLRNALRSVAAEIVVAFVYGSVAKASDHAHSDIDIMVVSDGLSYSEVCALLEPAADTLGRTVSPTLYTTSDYQSPANRRKSFLARVLEQPRIWLIGGENVSGA